MYSQTPHEGMTLYMVIDYDIYKGMIKKGDSDAYFVFYTDEYDDPLFAEEGSGTFIAIESKVEITPHGIISNKFKLFPFMKNAQDEVEKRKKLVREKFGNTESMLKEFFKAWRKGFESQFIADIVAEVVEEKFGVKVK